MYIETSVKTGYNAEKAFIELATAILESMGFLSKHITSLRFSLFSMKSHFLNKSVDGDSQLPALRSESTH
jgi:hypothetical protein